jgi:flagellar FliJ protein
MSVLGSLRLAIELATRQRDQAAMVLAQVRRNHAFAMDQMSQLQSYGVETETRWTYAAQGGVGPELLRHHLQFMGRLEHAIALQATALEGSGQKVDGAQQRLLAAEVRLKSLAKVLEQKQLAAAHLAQRREQKEMDEFAAQSAWQKQDFFKEAAR